MNAKEAAEWNWLMAWGDLGPDLCGAVPPAVFAGEFIVCELPAGHDGKHRDWVGWTWHGEKQEAS